MTAVPPSPPRIRPRWSLPSIVVLAVVLWPMFGQAQQAASQQGDGAAHSPAGHELYFGAVLFDKLEYGAGLGGPSLARWEGLAYYGTDYDRVFFRTQGETTRSARRIESAEFQLLYSRLISYFWDVQAGVRVDPGLLGRPDRTYAVAAIQGLAPGLFAVSAQVFASQTGAVSFRGEASYDIRITQRLVLQPEVEMNLAVQRDRDIEVGTGVRNVEAGLRLRYEITREVAPYVGITYARSLGDTARLRRADDPGGTIESWNLVTGLRLFF